MASICRTRKKHLEDLSRDTYTLLQQQAAVIGDLQDGLLKARGLSSSPIMADVLLVKVSGQLLAIPHGNAYEIIRATPQELAACYQGKTPGIAHAGAEYQVRYLGTMLGLEEPVLSSASKWYPVLLAGPVEQRQAIQLDQLLGSIQVMVQPLGAQLDSLHWFNGGTILADGRIALLLDINILLENFTRGWEVSGGLHQAPGSCQWLRRTWSNHVLSGLLLPLTGCKLLLPNAAVVEVSGYPETY